MLTPEELLQPRYKVIADYPNSHYKVGEILIDYKLLVNGVITDLENYPHLFKLLAWWEDRSPEDMPEYIKWVTTDGKTYVAKINNIMGDRFRFEMPDGTISRDIFTANQDYPATKEEYEASLKAKLPI